MESRKERRSRGRSRTNPNKVVLSCLVAGIILLSAGLASSDFFFFRGRIHYGASVAGADVSGMTRARARHNLYASNTAVLDSPLVVFHQGKLWQISPRDLNLNPGVEQAVESAYRLGRKGTLVRQIADRISLWRKPHDVELGWSFNRGKLKEFVGEIKNEAEIAPREAKIVVRGAEAVISPSREGLQIDEKKLMALLEQRLISPVGRRIHGQGRTLPVRVTTREAGLGLSETRRMLSGPLTLNFRQDKWILQPEEVGRLISFEERKQRANGSRFVSRLKPHLGRERTGETLKKMTEKIGTSARNAEFEVVGDRVSIIPSENGFEVDVGATLTNMEEALSNAHLRQASLVMSTTRPERTTEAAASMGIKEKVSTFTTQFDPRALPRVHNIRLLAGALDNTLVAPGDVFSFNGTIGPRTAAKGYQEAPTIVNGELVPTLGGGICQVGTTFFNAIFFAGLEIEERHNHSFYISKYPAGRDATVSWGGADLKFKNDTPNYLLVKTDSTQSSLTVSLYGTSPGRKVSFTSSPFSDFLPFTSRYVPDPGLAKDQQKVEESGVTGRHITVVRTVKQGGRVLHRDKLVSHYKPKKAVVRVGTGEAAPLPPVAAGDQAASPAAPEIPPSEAAPPSQQQTPTEAPQDAQAGGQGQ
jgi:vancomycin resistance protein YoaR